MAQPTSNRFYKGLNSDMSLTDRTQDMYLDGHNIRLARREEGTLWAANIRGNEETFQISEGFIPLGSQQFDGYLFIISVNPTTGVGEIGSFPSPAVGGGIQRAYRPLQNYTTQNYVAQIGDDCLLPDITNLGNFTTDLLNLHCDKPIRMVIRLDFDGSVNMYWSDDDNPWRVANNGFVLSTGESNRRYITSAMVSTGSINGINESDKHPIVNMLSVNSGGSLKVGNYFYFVRYTDLNYLSTSFLGQSGPIPIFFTQVIGSPITFGGEVDAVTDKAIDLLISNLDITSGFFEIGFIRYYGKDIFETFLIDKRYSIAGQPFRQVRITGNEPLAALTLDELVAYKPSDALYAKDLVQIQNQLYIANTRGPQLDHPDLRRFMCNLQLSEGYDSNGDAPEIRQDQNINPYSIDANDTEERVGYFSGETYIFAVIPVFRGGFTGLPYPLSGVDNYNGLSANVNKQGIYRFKKAHIANYWDGTDTYIKSIQVSNAAAAAIYASSQWLQDNLMGVYVCRGDRNKILLYQGLSLRCYNGKINPKLQEYNQSLFIYEQTGAVVPSAPRLFQPLEEDWASDRVMPMFEPASYDFNSRRENPLNPALGATGSYNYFMYAPPYQADTRNDFADSNRLGIFCTDYYIDKVIIPNTTYVQLIGTTSYSQDWNRECTAFNPLPINDRNMVNRFVTTPAGIAPSPLLDATINPVIIPANQGAAQTLVGYNQLGITYAVDGFSSSSIDIVGWNAVPSQGFTARFDEGRIASQDGLYYFRRNVIITNAEEYDISMPVATPDYIGIVNAPSRVAPFSAGVFDHYADKWDRAIVNVCRTNPDFVNYLDLYDFKNTEFYPIGTFQPIADFLSVPSHTYYRGDCLVTRSYIKIANGSVENLSSLFIDVLTNVTGSGTLPPGGNGGAAQEALQDGYGHWVSMVTEHQYNPNYRHELGRNLFYPKTSPTEPGTAFGWLVDSPESYFFNKGYAEYLGPRAGVGIDLLQPISDNKFPTRIRPSITHIFGAVRDGYRQFIPADAKDFDYSDGEIQALATANDILYSFQNRAINLHPINERVTSQSDQGSTAILGASQGLTQFRQKIKSGYGTQHRFSVINANDAIYCIDFNKRAILRIQGGGVENLEVTKGIQTWFRKIVSIWSSGYSDVMEKLPNAHPCGLGIHGAYNRKFKDVVWTLRLGDEDKTIVFSEEMDCFLGTHGYKPIHYGVVEEDMYSFIDNVGWLHDKLDNYDTFYGKLDEWFVKAVVNEGAEITKHWDNIIISSNNRVFAKVEYDTQHQHALQDPFIPSTEFWYAPTYRENQWRLPIRRQDNTKEPELSIYDDFTENLAPMRGRYIIIKLTYDQDKELWVRELITFYNQSFV